MENSKKTAIPIFPKNSRVCFLGDSLTSSGAWIELIFEYYLEKFPEGNIRIYNAGVGGGTINFTMNYLEEDLFSFKPTHVVIMYSDNDISSYDKKFTALEKAQAFNDDLHKLCNLIISRGIKVYFAIPPVSYSQDRSYNAARDIASFVLRSVAEEYGTGYVDFYNLMTPLIKDANLIDSDGVHPNRDGESVMAKLFLYSQGLSEFAPDNGKILDKWEMSPEGDHRLIFDQKLRKIWMAEANVLLSVIGASVEDKIKRLKSRIPTYADGAWDDFCYYRAIDYIELRPNMDDYRAEFDRTTEDMISKAKISGK